MQEPLALPTAQMHLLLAHTHTHTHEGKEKEIETFEINQTRSLFLSHSLAPPQIIKTLNASRSVPFARTHQPQEFRSKINIQNGAACVTRSLENN